MRKLASPKLIAFLAMCCFGFFFKSFKSSYFGPNGEVVESGDEFDAPDRQEEEVRGAEPVDPTRKKIQAVNMSSVDQTLNFLARPDVPTQTPWKAPIMWEGMFDGAVYDKAHREANTSVALTVFAVGRYLEAYLKNFIISAEKHFMIGIPLTYYIFTDTPEDVPEFVLGPDRTMKVLYTQGHSRWQDISMMRMKTLSQIIDKEISYKHPYVFCLDVDSIFEARFGTEALGESVTVLHSYYYTVKQEAFTYDRNPKSKAYMETGDYYYHAALFGGTWPNVKALVEYCYNGIMEDKKNNVEALWHDESHLNKYFWLHKPTKLLSPEYSWDAISLKDRKDIHVARMIWAKKRYDVLRG
ncbi:N-acetyllactosaminide alpha-1,3-galactosyltransferase-like [Boleophthalmus pectinirostris]|uniref:N-acetyllactosaminide alpha-1,3-galactosyltransferase-like n=1 Tax=Boleophthalmus pectinirostris TaxID=150288 RepID=UPI000A1C533B|nr:N-acetyllactosaminide alpha-1,3-galactosyltransferase-like [Boleophthalmus pectinirostris]